MRPHRIGLLLAIVLTIVTVLLRVEWPLPDFAKNKLDELFRSYQLELEYADATFDILGGVRLKGVSARYQGLLDISAAQFLVRIWPDKSIELAIDAGQFHTGFLLIALPELIRMDGHISLHPDNSVEIPQLRLQAGSLVMNVHGRGYPSAIVDKVGSNTGDLSFEQGGWIGALASILCRDPDDLWLGEIELDNDHFNITVSGQQINALDYDLLDPVVRFDYPLCTISAQVRRLVGNDLQAQNMAFYYDAKADHRWRLRLGEFVYEDFPQLTGGLSGNTNVMRAAELEQWRDIDGWVFFDNSLTELTNLNLAQRTGEIWGAMSDYLLKVFGLKLYSEYPFIVSGSFADKKLDFVARSQEGLFYRLGYGSSWVEGTLDSTGIDLGYFKVWDVDPSEYVEGALRYDFNTHNASYELWGEYNPGRLPWFGDKWTEAFEQFSNFRPAFACKLTDIKGGPIDVKGVGYQCGAAYHRLELGPTTASFVSSNRITDVRFDTKKDAERGKGVLRWSPVSKENPKEMVFRGNIQGSMLPKTLAKAYFDEPIDALENLQFRQLPRVSAELTKDTYVLTMQTLFPLSFYGLEIEGCFAKIEGSKQTAKIDPLKFGFAGGSGEATVEIAEDRTSKGELSIDSASFGRWALFGPLSNALEGTLLGFTSLALDNAHGKFIYDGTRLAVPEFEFKGPQHALSVWGDMNVQTKDLNFRARLNTLGGDSPTLPILAPIIRPITSVLEARLGGTLDDPQWNVKLRVPRF